MSTSSIRDLALLEADAALADRSGAAVSDADSLVIDAIVDAVLLVDADGLIARCNPAVEPLFGYAPIELVQRPVGLLLPALQGEGPRRDLLDALSQPDQPHEARHCEMAAHARYRFAFPAEIAASRILLGGRVAWVVSVRDVSRRLAVEQALRDSEARYRTLVDHAPEVIVVFDADTTQLFDLNRNAEALFGLPRSELLCRSMADFSATLQRAGRDALAVLRDHVALALDGVPQLFEWQVRTAQGAQRPCELRLARMPGTARQLVRCTITDISARQRDERIAAAERAVLEKVAANAALTESLHEICGYVETVAPGSIAAISVLAPGGLQFESLLAPRMPADLVALLDRQIIDIRHGSCAASVYLARPIYVADAATDPRWGARGEALRLHGLLSTWSVPVRAGGGRVVGAIGLYRRETGLPQQFEAELLADAARLAGIAIARRRAEEALRGSEAKYRGLFEAVMEGVYRSTPDGRLVSVNPAFVQMLGFDSAEEVYALPSAAMLYWRAADRADFTRQLELAGEMRNAEFTLRRRDGAQIVVLESARALRDPDGRVVAYEGTIADITERKRAEQAMFQEKERAEVTLQSIGDAVITTDAGGRIDYMNPVAEQLTGWRLLEVQGHSIESVLRLVDDASRAPLENPLLRALASGTQVGPTDQCVLVDRTGHDLAIQDSAAPIRDRAGQITGAVVVFHDVTRERRLRRALAYQATHDALTGLINRREFDNRLQAAVQSVRDDGSRYAVLYIDLDQFKLVNDTCGHSAGDRLIREITGLIQARVRTTDTIARLGGDEFGVLLADCALEQAGGIADSMRRAIRDHRFQWNGSSLAVGASIGVVEVDAQIESAAALLSAADVACYTAKDSGRNRIELYHADRGRDRHREMRWVAQIARAIEEDRVELVHQPIRPLGAGGPRVFHEVMVRMRSETGELIPPDQFIPAAERYNVMPAIDFRVLERVVSHLQALPPTALRPLLAVNVSGNSLSDQSFLERVLALVDRSGVATSLCFEITETAAVSHLDTAVLFMRELKARGCRFSLDDFGSGLSSFRYLKNLPIDFLKIDGEFVAHVGTDAVDRSVVRAIVQVGRSLGIATVAEKVETADVLELLMEIGVDFAQGYHIARPQPLLRGIPVAFG
jgi:diguanylate cyclase (GGDEF)-like protein/PAS domain S-box-containing protein